MSEYHKIETLYERDPKTFKVIVGEFKNRTYTLLKQWHWTEKIDGTNVRVIWTPTTSEQPFMLSFGGKTNEAQLHTELYKHLQETFTPEKLNAVFPNAQAVLYGEGFGAGIQKGGGDYSPTKKFILFDVLVDNKWWLSYENVCDVATKLEIPVVPAYGNLTIEQATEIVRTGFPSLLPGSHKQAEGLVGRPLEALFDKKGHRLITKLKTKDF